MLRTFLAGLSQRSIDAVLRYLRESILDGPPPCSSLGGPDPRRDRGSNHSGVGPEAVPVAKFAIMVHRTWSGGLVRCVSVVPPIISQFQPRLSSDWIAVHVDELHFLVSASMFVSRAEVRWHATAQSVLAVIQGLGTVTGSFLSGWLLVRCSAADGRVAWDSFWGIAGIFAFVVTLVAIWFRPLDRPADGVN